MAADAASGLLDSKEIPPDAVQALLELGLRHRQQGRFQDAAGCFARGLSLRPDNPELHHAFGIALDDLSRPAAAEACFRRALRLRPNFAEALNNLGHVLRKQNRLAEAEDCHCRALAIKPDFPDALLHLGVTLREQGRLTEAAACHRRVTAVRPDGADAWWHLGGILREQGRLAEAAACQQRVLALIPDHAGAYLQLAYILLSSGDIAAGSAAFECRWGKGQNRRYPVQDRPLWNGRPIPGQTLLLWGELGFGDVIQFVRYARRVRAIAGRLVLHCHPSLVALLSTASGIDEIVPTGMPLPAFDAFIPIASLMRVLGTTLDTIPAEIPYLAADADRMAALAPRLVGGGVKVGIAWAGNPRHGNDRRRSLPLAALAPLLDMPNIRFFSLQASAFTGQPDARAADIQGSRQVSR